MSIIRLTDWNSVIGTVMISGLFITLSAYSVIDPSFFDDDRIMAMIIPYIGPVIAAGALYRLVFYVEIGPQLAFLRLFGRRTYNWEDLKAVSKQCVTKRYLFGLVRLKHEYLIFALTKDGEDQYHSYRIPKKHTEALVQAIQQYAPQIIRADKSWVATVHKPSN